MTSLAFHLACALLYLGLHLSQGVLQHLQAAFLQVHSKILMQVEQHNQVQQGLALKSSSEQSGFTLLDMLIALLCYSTVLAALHGWLSKTVLAYRSCLALSEHNLQLAEVSGLMEQQLGGLGGGQIQYVRHGPYASTQRRLSLRCCRTTQQGLCRMHSGFWLGVSTSTTGQKGLYMQPWEQGKKQLWSSNIKSMQVVYLHPHLLRLKIDFPRKTSQEPLVFDQYIRLSPAHSCEQGFVLVVVLLALSFQASLLIDLAQQLQFQQHYSITVMESSMIP